MYSEFSFRSKSRKRFNSFGGKMENMHCHKMDDTYHSSTKKCPRRSLTSNGLDL